MSADDPTIWQIVSGRSRDLMAGKTFLPLFLAFIYGCYKLIKLGFAPEHYLLTYVPIFGAIAAGIGVSAYAAVTSHDRRGWMSTVKAISGFLPYAFSLYIMGFLGAYQIWLSFSPLNFWDLIKGMLWVYLGYRLLRKFWIITELARLPADNPDFADVLVNKLGMRKRDLLPLMHDEKANEYFRSRFE